MTHNTVSLGYVYLFENEFNYVKVGHSNNPDNRAKTIESASGVTVIKSYVSPICNNSVEIERELQQRFAPFRKKGEWFDIEFATAQAALDSYFPKKTETSDIETLIPLSNQAFNENREEYSVNARDLHAFLESKQEFANWIKNRISEYEFVEGQDFLTNLSKTPSGAGGRPAKEYSLTINMAKELSMVEKNAKGKEARQYFIACEKALKQGKSLTVVNEDDVRINHHICEITKIALGITEKQHNGNQEIVFCKQCGKSFQKRNYRHVYCCEECRIKAHGYTTKGELLARKKWSRG